MRGGKRPGAGRPAGSATRKTSAVARSAASQGITPIQVLLHHMREAHAAGDVAVAVDCATRAAPFIHPRLSAVAIDLKDLSDEDLRSMLAE